MGPTIETRADPDARPATSRLTILYDERCPLCRRVRDWLLTQPCLVPVELVAAGSQEARTRFGAIPWVGEELVVVDDQGRAWIGPAAYLTALWATHRYRWWAYRLSGPHMAPMAERFFRWLTRRRDRFGTWFGREEDDCSWCDRMRIDGTE